MVAELGKNTSKNMDSIYNSTNTVDETLLKLAESLNQYSASSISSIQIPEYRGAPNENVDDFLNKFKLATISLNDQLRCLALQKALTGDARVWAKSIKKQIQAGDFKLVKKALQERFAAPNRELRHQEKLTTMKYEPTCTLTSYVENFADTYRKAYVNTIDADIIKGLRLNLPKNILKHLNILEEDWAEGNDMGQFLKLVRRIEAKILPYEADESQEEKLNISTLTKLFKELQDNIRAQQAKNEEPKKEETSENTVATVQVTAYPKQVQNSQQNQNSYQRQPNWGRNKAYNNYNHNYGQQFQRQQPYRTQYSPMLPQKQPQQSTSENDQKTSNELDQLYEERYGKPPGPCQICGGHHFNRDCPYKGLRRLN